MASKARLSIDGKERPIASPAALKKALANLAAASEVWLHRADGPALCLLIHEERGWLMYLREAGDAGMSSRATGTFARKRGTLSFRLANGQVDDYPARWTVPLADALRAIEHVFEAGEPPPFITWHMD